MLKAVAGLNPPLPASPSNADAVDVDSPGNGVVPAAAVDTPRLPTVLVLGKEIEVPVPSPNALLPLVNPPDDTANGATLDSPNAGAAELVFEPLNADAGPIPALLKPVKAPLAAGVLNPANGCAMVEESCHLRFRNALKINYSKFDITRHRRAVYSRLSYKSSILFISVGNFILCSW